jgi:Protein of unknown function (DUF1592)/Protein of unknown function (DUF1588)/Protein of unknown function (DUF1595)/Protein of unknown function (DUF1587)/Protein of unknown function (DUF1585)
LGQGPLDAETGLPNDCEAAGELAAAAPLTRLTNREYESTLAALFPSAVLAAPVLPTESKNDGFDNVGKNQSPTAVWVEAYFEQAGVVASRVAAGVVAACGSSDAACAEAALLGLAERVFRKPVADDERQRLVTVLTEATAKWGLAKGAEVAVRGLLQTPQFLYRLELGVQQAGQASLALSPFELASRLSYLLWDNMPDDALLASARAGTLSQPAELEAQARRLLAAPPARQAVALFHSQWLRFEKMATLAKSEALFPSFDVATADALRASTERFVDAAFWEQRSLDRFLTSPTVYANASIAPILGVAVGGSELLAVQGPAGQRAGILTQPGLLAGFAHETAGSPVLRGVFVLDRLLCAKPAPPPPNVPPAPAANESGPASTTRQKFEQHLNSPVCNACHQTIDGIGFGFENYDAVGAYRTEESGIPVDASGEVLGSLDADGSFDGAVELGARLAGSKQTQACVSRFWYRYAFGLADGDVNACALLPVVRDFQSSGLDLQELVVAIVRSSSFRTRPALVE